MKIKRFLCSTLRSLRFCGEVVFVAAFSLHAADTVRVLDDKTYHLGTAGLPEWAEFDNKTPHGRRLDIPFKAEENAEPCTIFITQYNVKYAWPVLLNGKKLGELLPMDALQLNAYEIPAKALKNGENTLSILSPLATNDILVSDFRLDTRPRAKAINQARLQIKVTEGGRDARAPETAGLPCRITLVDHAGALMPLVVLDENANDPSHLISSRTGAVYTRDGVAMLGVLPGDYTVYATRGFEYSMATQQVTVAAGQTQHVALQITREVPTPGLIAADTHIHTLTFSKHGDATVDERMLTIAGEGIELAVSTEHNHHADYSEAQARTGMQPHFTSVRGNEVTTKVGHFNAFPVNPGSTPPDFKVEDWPVLLQSIRTTPGVQVVTLNHPRDLHNIVPFAPQYFNAVTGESYRAAELNFDAIEVITSAALQSDIELLYHDWFALLNRGVNVSGIASSDSHDVTRFILGQGRTYVVCDDSKPGQINIDQACKSFREGRVLASMGLLTDIRVNERFVPGDLATGLGDQINVAVTVLGPSWVSADNVKLFANGVKIQEQQIAPTTKVEKAKITWTLARPAQDTHLVAIATGPGVTAPCWAIPRPYQPSSKTWTPRVIGSTNPVWLDCDGDGKYTSPRALAEKLLKDSSNDPGKLIALLATHDRAVAIQAADLCKNSGFNLKAESFQALLNTAPEMIRNAFADFLESLNQREAKK